MLSVQGYFRLVPRFLEIFHPIDQFQKGLKQFLSKLDVANNKNDLPTEQEINEWTKRSRKEGICGIVNRLNNPAKQCKRCTNYCCSEHFPSHLDLLPEGDLEYSSSNEGLERNMDESDDDLSLNEDPVTG
jgi:hypothetical protein